MGTSRKDAGLLDAPEKVLWVGEQGSGAITDHPSLLCAASLNTPLLGGACFHTHSSRDKSDEDLSVLVHENADLEAEQLSLLLRNSELLSRTLLLKLENRRLKEQLERQLHNTHITASSPMSSSSGSSLVFEEDSSDSDNEEFVSYAVETGISEVKLASTSGDDIYST